ncbi:MAG TPA: hypothetical protein VEB86_05375 [Chryseosolibacter sp.]|nr:hypothetical protein [Chryseosolibacter sp.]
MRKHMILVAIAASFVLGANAQDSMRVDTSHHLPHRRPDPSPPSSTQQQIPPSDNYRSTDPLIQIRMDAVPSGLKKTLMGPEYRGWENSTIFQNGKTFEYSIDIRSGDSLKTFRFDRFGNPLNPNTPVKDD